MTDVGPAPTGSSLIDRAKAIILSPNTEWPRIDAEPSTISDIYRSHVLPLAAIGPVALFIGGQAFGFGAFGISYRPSLMSGIVTALVSYVLALVGTYLVALVIDALAPQFGAVKNRTQAFKVAAYSFTASWLAGIFGILPALSFLSILGLYSLYLIYTGLPILMKAPADKAVSYSVASIVVSIIAGIVLAAVAAPITMMFAGSGTLSAGNLSTGTAGGTLSVPGAGSVDLGKLEAAGKKMEEAAQRVQSGQAGPVIAPDVLQSLLPGALPGGLARTSIESSSAGAAGIGGSTAEARYGSGENEIVLKVTDLGAMGGLAAMGSAFNVQSSKQTETGYERMGKVEGRMTTEKYDNTDKRGSYGTLVADRIMVESEGRAASAEAFKAAVATVDLSKIETLAKQ